MASKKKPAPYWLVAVEEYCEDCEQPYAYAVEARCVGCDKPLCTICTINEDGDVFCKECSPERKAKRRR